MKDTAMSGYIFNFKPIGVISSPYKKLSEIPIQPILCENLEGTVILDTPYIDGLKGLQGFSHIYLFYCFNQSEDTCLRLKTYLSDEEHGIFATRAPYRPNKLGMSLVQLEKVENNILYVKDVDILDGTPLLDIKPYIKKIDSIENAKSGWVDAVPDDVISTRGLRDFYKQKKIQPVWATFVNNSLEDPHWVILFKIPTPDGVIIHPAANVVIVYDDGKVEEMPGGIRVVFGGHNT